MGGFRSLLVEMRQEEVIGELPVEGSEGLKVKQRVGRHVNGEPGAPAAEGYRNASVFHNSFTGRCLNYELI